MTENFFSNDLARLRLRVRATGGMLPRMHEIKDTLRASVRIGYDGRVHKVFRGPRADERFANETRVLRFLEARNCPFVPRLLESDAEQLKIVTSNCGSRVERMDDARLRELFEELETYGVRHDDAELRNVTYRQSDGRFCLIDFEFATILEGVERDDVRADEGESASAAPAVVGADRPGPGSQK